MQHISDNTTSAFPELELYLEGDKNSLSESYQNLPEGLQHCKRNRFVVSCEKAGFRIFCWTLKWVVMWVGDKCFKSMDCFLKVSHFFLVILVKVTCFSNLRAFRSIPRKKDSYGLTKFHICVSSSMSYALAKVRSSKVTILKEIAMAMKCKCSISSYSSAWFSNTRLVAIKPNLNISALVGEENNVSL